MIFRLQIQRRWLHRSLQLDVSETYCLFTTMQHSWRLPPSACRPSIAAQSHVQRLHSPLSAPPRLNQSRRRTARSPREATARTWQRTSALLRELGRESETRAATLLGQRAARRRESAGSAPAPGRAAVSQQRCSRIWCVVRRARLWCVVRRDCYRLWCVVRCKSR